MVQAHSPTPAPVDQHPPQSGGDARTGRDHTAAPDQNSDLGRLYYYIESPETGVVR